MRNTRCAPVGEPHRCRSASSAKRPALALGGRSGRFAFRFASRFPLSASLRTSLPIARVTPFERASADRLDRGSSRQRAAISQPRTALDRFGARRRVADRIRQPPNRRIAPIRTAGEGRPRANSTVFSFGDIGKRLSTHTLNRQTIANELNRESTYLINTNVQFNCQINSNS